MQMGAQMTFNEELTQKAQECETIIRRFLPAEEGYAAQVKRAMNYSILAGGKRLRPMFIMETARMYDGRPDLYEPFMAALEMIHTYSLIHDDLPAMDNDQYRRGRKTCWAVYGDGMAVLAGDGLLNLAFETALRAFDQVHDSRENQAVIRAMKVLAGNAGADGMVGGQCADLVADEHPEIQDEDLLHYIHTRKTACLMESGFQIGAIVALAPQKDIEKLGKIAEMTGIAFQIQDDILDVVGDQKELGKSIGKDAQEGKLTYVSMYGLDKAKETVRSMTEDALSLYDSLSRSNDYLRALIVSLIDRRK